MALHLFSIEEIMADFLTPDVDLFPSGRDGGFVIEGEQEETPEQREERLKREDYARRWHQAAIEREDILRRNGVIGPDDKLDMDLEAAIRQRCCF